ncbi:MAG TPA: beta-ketoacyl synthase chain length factor [Pseudolabrys sp.]|nr:beta-ketoacyl synthase chain length factor [Pseudolabrys sp.]
MNPLAAYIDGVGVIGPGLNDWSAARSILSGEMPYQFQPVVLPLPESLPPAERRRCGPLVKLTLAVGLEAVAAAGVDVKVVPTVFSASSGDGRVINDICETLASADRRISPTQFHMSVHNAASGFWSIATGAMAPSSVLCAREGSFGAGVLEAITQVVVDGGPVLLVAYDTSYPEPLRSAAQTSEVLGIALVFSAQRRKHSLTKISVTLTQAAAGRMADAGLEALRGSVPTGRGLPLLASLARGEAASLVLDYLSSTQLSVDVSPCS